MTDKYPFLTDIQRYVTQSAGTEAPFTGRLLHQFNVGNYYCICCDQLLFLSDCKFDAGCGWPSFFEAASDSNIIYREDSSHGMIRTEICCATCNAHLGHVFNDGPAPTYKRYCLNSAALYFIDKKTGNKING